MKRSRVNGPNDGLAMPRSRGAITGFLLIILGVWGALAPFLGPRFNFAYSTDRLWAWTAARGWLEVFPGAATVVGGLLLLGSANLLTAMMSAWLAVVAGAWFVVGRTVAPLLRFGGVGDPVASTDAKRVLLDVTYFSGLGAVVIFLGGVALGRLSARSDRGIERTRGELAYDSSPTNAFTGAVPTAEPQHQRTGLFRRRRTKTPTT